MGCGTCNEKVMGGINSKDREEMTQQEMEVYEGEREPPFAQGPLSEWGQNGGYYCNFCHMVGHVGVWTIASMIVFFGWYFSVSPIYSIPFAFITGIIGSLVVGWLGRFPVLGAYVGPFVEKYFAVYFSVYLTEQAREEYQTAGEAMEQDGEVKDARVMDTMTKEGIEVHIVATEMAKELCKEPKYGTVKGIIVEKGQIIDEIDMSSNPHFNSFQNVQDYAGLYDNNTQTVCESASLITEAEFRDNVLLFDQHGTDVAKQMNAQNG